MSEQLIKRMVAAAIGAANPAAAVTGWFANNDFQHSQIKVVSVGKASVAMAQAALAHLGERVREGVVISKAAQATVPEPLRHFQGSHPIPDARSIAATHAVQALLTSATKDDHILCLISGGASALLTDPVLPLAQWQALNAALLSCGCRINEINHVRQHLDRVKGGGLLHDAGFAACTTLILSDVIGNDLGHIGSGPTVPTPRDVAGVREILDRYQLATYLSPTTLAAVNKHLADKVVAPRYPRIHNEIVGDVQSAAAAAAAVAATHGYATAVVATDLVGEAREVGRRLAQAALSLPGGTCHVYGGETTVTLAAEGNGVGGRNQELALAAAIVLAGEPDVWLATLATDGEDGPNAAAGAIVNGETVALARQRGLSAESALAQHDSYTFFDRLGHGHLRIGSTGTNVNDITIVLKSR